MKIFMLSYLLLLLLGIYPKKIVQNMEKVLCLKMLMDIFCEINSEATQMANNTLRHIYLRIIRNH